MRASAVLNCHRTVLFSLFRCVTHDCTSSAIFAMLAILRPRHCRLRTPISNSAMFSHEPCFGVWWISKRSHKRLAILGSKAVYNAAGEWVFKLSMTKTIFSASGYCTSARWRKQCAKSCAVRLSVTATSRLWASGSSIMNRLATPLRAYS